MKTSTLVQAHNPHILQTAVNALLTAGKEVYLVTPLADKSWYLVIHDA